MGSVSAEAAHGNRQVRMRYRSGCSEEPDHVVKSYGVARWSHAWYLVANCRSRAGLRRVQLDRVYEVERLGDSFPSACGGW